jgi:glycosyltransferase involved in cell wall biosynthesis
MNVSFFKRMIFLMKFVRSRIYWRELVDILETREKVFQRIIYISFIFSKFKIFFYKLKKLDIVEEFDIIYSYWHSYKVLAVGELIKNKKIPIISRTHGQDLYNERISPSRRQPFIPSMDRYLSSLVFVSKAGFSYYQRFFGFLPSCDYRISYLGVSAREKLTSKSNIEGLSIISISNAIPLKRINLIIESLSLIESYNIVWTHIGGGSDLLKLKTIAETTFEKKNNIEYNFLGSVPNSFIHDFYNKSAIDVFITTSSTEGGCPVSIQEAFAYGIPAIGTDVGGIGEMIINKQNGVLLSNNPSPIEIKESLDFMFINKQTEVFDKMKIEAFNTWETKFNAEKNFNVFAQFLNLL